MAPAIQFSLLQIQVVLKVASNLVLFHRSKAQLVRRLVPWDGCASEQFSKELILMVLRRGGVTPVLVPRVQWMSYKI